MTADPSSNPFIAHRHHLDVYHYARSRGLDDEGYRQLVDRADDRLVETVGQGFETTPLLPLDLFHVPCTADLGRVVAKVETGAVGGSHKARHLFGLLLRLLIDGDSAGADGHPPLAIASCGNAALGAAIVARSAQRRLRVFVPADADPTVLADLECFGADVAVCTRTPESPPGDPCLTALDRAVEEGAVPFTVQGTRAPSVIDGGRTLGLELAAQLEQRGLEPTRLFVQVGGGALATAVMDGLTRARPGTPPPRLHPVQAASAHPYVACWKRAVPVLLAAGSLTVDGADDQIAAALADAFSAEELHALLSRAPGLMVPWPGQPRSVATGILDDVTYDWQTVMVHQILSGGWPITVTEATLMTAAAAAATVTPAPDETGAAGLAGLLTLAAEDDAGTGPGEVNVVLLTGVRRT